MTTTPKTLSPAAQEDALAATMENAAKLLYLDTLETRKSDALDFHDLAVWQLKEVVRMAFEAGRNA
jgi:hypothetical protein